jgi:hypothetical protein
MTTMTRTLRQLLSEPLTDAKAIYECLHNDGGTTTDSDLGSVLREMKTLTLARRAEVVASLWATRRRPLLKQILEDYPELREPQVLHKATSLLDLPRRVRAAERRLSQLEERGAKAKAVRAQRAVLGEMRDAATAVPTTFSASKSFADVLRKQLRLLPEERLEFDLLFFEDGP